MWWFLVPACTSSGFGRMVGAVMRHVGTHAIAIADFRLNQYGFVVLITLRSYMWPSHPGDYLKSGAPTRRGAWRKTMRDPFAIPLVGLSIQPTRVQVMSSGPMGTDEMRREADRQAELAQKRRTERMVRGSQRALPPDIRLRRDCD